MDANMQELVNGLISKPKYLPFWYHYDDEGSRLFDELIEKCAWYYFHRYELQLLQSTSNRIVNDLKTPIALVDLGSGNAVKTRLLFDQLLQKDTYIVYMPVDISKEYLENITKQLKNEYGNAIEIRQFGCHYFDALEEIRKYPERKLYVWFGGLQCLSYKDQIHYLTEISKAMDYDDSLLITADITDHSQKRTIELAYLDPEGYEGRFHFNCINRLNREFKGNIDISKFEMKNKVVLNKSADSCSYNAVWMEALEDSVFNIDGLNLTLKFQRGEKLFFHEGEGSSCKYTIEQIKHICDQGSFLVVDQWTNRHVGCLLLKRK